MSKVKHEFKVDAGKLEISVSLDLNEDGEPVVENITRVNILEIPDEVMSAMVSHKESAKA
jgi:hypothetical protein